MLKENGELYYYPSFPDDPYYKDFIDEYVENIDRDEALHFLAVSAV
jgi:hypothetical protein